MFSMAATICAIFSLPCWELFLTSAVTPAAQPALPAMVPIWALISAMEAESSSTEDACRAAPSARVLPESAMFREPLATCWEAVEIFLSRSLSCADISLKAPATAPISSWLSACKDTDKSPPAMRLAPACSSDNGFRSRPLRILPQAAPARSVSSMPMPIISTRKRDALSTSAFGTVTTYFMPLASTEYPAT